MRAAWSRCCLHHKQYRTERLTVAELEGVSQLERYLLFVAVSLARIAWKQDQASITMTLDDSRPVRVADALADGSARTTRRVANPVPRMTGTRPVCRLRASWGLNGHQNCKTIQLKWWPHLCLLGLRCMVKHGVQSWYRKVCALQQVRYLRDLL